MSTCQTCHNKGIIQHRHEHGPYCYIETYHGDKLICTTQYDEEKCPECYFNKLFKEYLKTNHIQPKSDLAANLWDVLQNKALVEARNKYEFKNKLQN